MFVNFRISATLIVLLLARSKGPWPSESELLIYLLYSYHSWSVHFFLRFSDFEIYF